MPIDDSKIDDYLQKLQDKSSTLQSQLNDIRQIQQNLAKIRSVLIRTDVIKGVSTPVYSDPPDNDLGVDTMDMQKRQAIYDANCKRADSVLGSV